MSKQDETVVRRQERPLRELLEGVTVQASGGDLETPIKGLAIDSRFTGEGDLFIALPGQHVDGHDFIPQAIERGVAAIIVQSPGSWKGPWVSVPDSLDALARISANFYEHPARSLNLIAVTGSNGKTTCTYLIEAQLQAAGRVSGRLSTTEYHCPGWSQPAPATTPLAIDLHRYFHQMRRAAVTDVVMEVSSHAIVLKRILGLQFRTALFTNLTQDHLDFHKTMSEYGRAKKALFQQYLQSNGTAVLNGDDPYVRTLLGQLPERRQLSYGLQEGAAVRATEIDSGVHGSTFTLATPAGSIRIESPLLGAYNVENLLAAAAVALAEGVPLESIQRGLQSVKAVPGRLEPVECGQAFKVLVDYAHTPDALRRVLTLLRRLPHHRILTVFGCGGERDRKKRPLMGSIACQLSDQIFLTSDNPRAEDPRAIIQEIEGGMKGHESKYRIILDRREAIVSAIEAATEFDIVLLAGKGHEVTQTWADRTRPFDDRKVAESALRRR